MRMFDSVDTHNLPAGAAAYAGYVDGAWPTFSRLRNMFPSAHILSIAVFPWDDADALDVEAGDATNAQVYGWYLRQRARFSYRPCVYTSASNAYAMQETMAANGFARSGYRLWTAHYTGTAHFCAPGTCGYGRDQADATQYSDNALGRSLDESLVADDFFGAPFSPVTNPVSGLTVTRRGYTSMDLAWDAQKDAIGYTVKAYWRGVVVAEEKVSTASVRMRRLDFLHTYEFRVRAHPGGSAGADATIKATTR